MGPLQGLRIVEMAGIGPAPFAGMMLADMGAEVVRIDRLQTEDLGLPEQTEAKYDVLARGRRSLGVNLKSGAGRDVVLRMIRAADGLIEGFRPGVMERLGLGPDMCLRLNPRLVYGRVTGYGQDGPMSLRAGHDINYISIGGALHAIGPAGGPPVPPLNLVGDFGGGGMLLAFGLVAAMLWAARTGDGQVVDAAMVDGTASLMGMVQGLVAAGVWRDQRGVNILDGAAPFYRTYETKDGKYVAVGAIERRFYLELLVGLGLNREPLPDQHDRSRWPELSQRFAAVFATRTRAEWEHAFAASDACVTPVLSIAEATEHPHNRARRTFLERDGVPQPAPAPRFSRTSPETGEAGRAPDADSADVLQSFGFAEDEIERMVATGVIGRASRQG